MEIQVIQMGTFGLAKEWVALAVFVLVLLALALDIAHRTWIAFAGSFTMLGESAVFCALPCVDSNEISLPPTEGLLLLANNVPGIHEVMGWVDYGTLGLLFGMMLIVGQVRRASEGESSSPALKLLLPLSAPTDGGLPGHVRGLPEAEQWQTALPHMLAQLHHGVPLSVARQRDDHVADGAHHHLRLQRHGQRPRAAAHAAGEGRRRQGACRQLPELLCLRRLA